MANEESKWDYKPGETESDGGKAPKTGLITWSASEFIDHKQGFSWFLGLAAATIVLGAGVYFFTSDYFASGVILALGIIVGIFAKRSPRQLTYELSGSGLKIEQKAYPYSLFKTFSIVADGVLTSIDFMPVKRFMPTVSAYFDPADQEKIVAVLQQHLPYEESQLDRVERLTRRLRF